MPGIGRISELPWNLWLLKCSHTFRRKIRVVNLSLWLSLSGLKDCGFVSLPCLKSLHLVDIRWVKPMDLEKLIKGCPVLEELTLQRDLCFEPVFTRVRSRSLKKLCFTPTKRYRRGMMQEYKVEVDAPGLEFLSLREGHFDRVVVKNLSSLFIINLDVESCMRNEVRDFLAGVSECKTYDHLWENSEDVFELLHVPRCLLSTLECVEIRRIFDWGEDEMKITSYFLENSRVLKKLILSFGGCPQHYSESEIYEEIGKLTKGCGGCEVIIDSEF